jgi:hypothetical protein
MIKIESLTKTPTTTPLNKTITLEQACIMQESHEDIKGFLKTIQSGVVNNIQMINESEFDQILLNEKWSYPDDIDEIFNLVWDRLIPEIIGLRAEEKKYVFINIETKYFKKLTIMLEPKYESDINSFYNQFNYSGKYSTDAKFIDGKLSNPFIILTYPITNNGSTWIGYIASVLSHELTHLYDDCITREKKGISYVKSRIEPSDSDISLSGILSNEKNPLLFRLIANIIYIRRKAEQKAFLAQAMRELKELGCTNKNYQDVLKETSVYTIIETIRNDSEKIISSASEDDFKNLNTLIHKNGKSSLPKMPEDRFSPIEYKTKIKKFIDSLLHQYLKKYLSIVNYYLNGWSNKNNQQIQGKWT